MSEQNQTAPHHQPPADGQPSVQPLQITTRTRRRIFHALVDLLAFAGDSLPRFASWRQFWRGYCKDLELPLYGVESNRALYLRLASNKTEAVDEKTSDVFQILFQDHLAHEATTAQHVVKAIDSAFGFVANAIDRCDTDHRYRHITDRWEEYNHKVHHMNDILAEEKIDFILTRILPYEQHGKVQMRPLTPELAEQEALRAAAASFGILVQQAKRRTGVALDDTMDASDEADPQENAILMRKEKQRAIDEQLVAAGEARIQDGKTVLTEAALAGIKPLFDQIQQQTGIDLTPDALKVTDILIKGRADTQEQEDQQRRLIDNFLHSLEKHEILVNKKGTNGVSGGKISVFPPSPFVTPWKNSENCQNASLENAKKRQKKPKNTKKCEKILRPSTPQPAAGKPPYTHPPPLPDNDGD